MAVLSKIAIWCVLALMTSPLQGFASAPADVQAVAEEGLAQFLANIVPQELANMGLTSAADIKAATLGEPYEQFTIYPDALKNYTPDQSISSLLTSTENWVYPVLVNGRARTQMNVVKSEGQWVAGFFGGTLPARIHDGVSSMNATLGTDSGRGITSAGIEAAKLVRIPQINADFLFVGAGDDEYLFPISSDRALTQVVGGKVYSGLEIIPLLNLEVDQAIRAWNKSQGE